MKYYLQLDKDNIIVDCITKPHSGYVKWEGEILEPIHAGWHKMLNNKVIKDNDLFIKLNQEVSDNGDN